MGCSVTEIRRPVRRRLKRTVHKSPDKDHARRALAVLQLWETGDNVAEVRIDSLILLPRRICCLMGLLPKFLEVADEQSHQCAGEERAT